MAGKRNSSPRAEKSKKVTGYKPTPAEERVLDSHRARRVKGELRPGLKVTIEGNKENISVDYPDEAVGGSLLMEAMGAADVKFDIGLINQLRRLSSRQGLADEERLNFLLSMVTGIEPRDQLEAMLATQMAAVHDATITFACRLKSVETIQQQDSAERALNKLARTFTAQIDALKRYRTGGEQKVTVEHVHVHEGGQAIVGNVTHEGGGGAKKSGDQSHEKQITNAPGTAMPCDLEAEREAMPSTSGSRM